MLNRIRQRLADILWPRNSQGGEGPLVSFVLIVYDMPEQAANTVRSLFVEYQEESRPQDFEVLIVENESANVMDQGFIRSLPGNFHYFLRQETQPTPVHAINFGLEKAVGQNICVMIDGARVLTPGVTKNVIRGHTLSERAVVTVPGYHLGHELQQKAVESGYDQEQERALMNAIGWPADGYRLFEISCFSGSCAGGFYSPHSESNCISMPRAMWRDLGGYDARFDKRGGGVVNLDLYKRACEYPGAMHVFLHGEGTFHQFHGGVTTGGEDTEARQRFIDEIMGQYQEIHGRKYENPVTNTVYLGEIPDAAHRFVNISSNQKLNQLGREAEAQRALA